MTKPWHFSRVRNYRDLYREMYGEVCRLTDDAIHRIAEEMPILASAFDHDRAILMDMRASTSIGAL